MLEKVQALKKKEKTNSASLSNPCECERDKDLIGILRFSEEFYFLPDPVLPSLNNLVKKGHVEF